MSKRFLVYVPGLIALTCAGMYGMDIDTGEPVGPDTELMTVSVQNSLNEYSITKALLTLFATLQQVYQAGKIDYTVTSGADNVLAFVINLGNAYLRSNGNQSDEIKQLLATLDTDMLIAAIAMVKTLGSKQLDLLLAEEAFKRYRAEEEAREAERNKEITVIVGNSSYKIKKKELPFLRTIQEMVDIFGEQEDLPLTDFNRVSFELLLHILRQCFVDREKPQIAPLVKILQGLSVQNVCTLAQLADRAGFDALYDDIIKYFVKNIQKGHITGDALRYLEKALDNTAVMRIKTSLVNSCKRYMKQNRIHKGTWVKLFDLPANATSSVLLSPDGTRVCVEVGDELLILNSSTGVTVAQLNAADIADEIAFGNNSNHIIIQKKDASICLWDISKGTVMPLTGAANKSHIGTYRIQWSSDDTKICIAIPGGICKILSGKNFATTEEIDLRSAVSMHSVFSMAWSPDTRYCFMCGLDINRQHGVVVVYDTRTKKGYHQTYQAFGESVLTHLNDNDFLLLDDRGYIRFITLIPESLQFMMKRPVQGALWEGEAQPNKILIGHATEYAIVFETAGNFIIDTHTGIVLQEFDKTFPVVWSAHDETLVACMRKAVHVMRFNNKSDEDLVAYLYKIPLDAVAQLLGIMNTISAGGAVPTLLELAEIVRVGEATEAVAPDIIIQLLHMLMQSIAPQHMIYDPDHEFVQNIGQERQGLAMEIDESAEFPELGKAFGAPH